MQKINELLNKYLLELSADNKYMRRTAARELGTLKNSAAVEHLIRELKTTDIPLKKEIIRSLKEIDDSRAIKPLLDLFKVESSNSVKAWIAWALGHFINYTFPMDDLVEVLNEDDFFLKRNIIFAIGNNRFRKATPKLIDILNKEKSINIKKMIIWSLGQLNCKEATVPLFAALNDPSYKVRETAGYILTSFSYTKHRVKELLELLDEESFRGRTSVVFILGKIRCSESVPKLIDIVRSNENSHIRLQAIRTLGKIRDPKSLESIVEVINDPDSNIRKEAINSLRYFFRNVTIEMISKVIESLNDDDKFVRLAAVNFIQTIRGTMYIPIEVDNAIPKLLDMFANDSFEKIQLMISYLCSSVDDDRIIQAMRFQVFNHQSDLMKIHAGRALGPFIDEPVLLELIKALGSQDKRVRRTASSALYHKKIGKHLGILLEMFKNKQNPGRREILSLLVNNASKEVIGELVKILELETDDGLKKAIITNFWGMKDKRVINVLKRIQDNDPTEEIRQEAEKMHNILSGQVSDAYSYYFGEETKKEPNPFEGEMDIEKIIEAAKHSQKNKERMQAIIELKRFAKDERIVEPIIEALDDHNSRVRMAAAFIPRKVQSSLLVKPLITALSDWHQKVRTIAAKTLIRMDNTRDEEDLLISLLRDKEHLGRKQLITILCKIQSRKSVPVLLDILENSSDVTLRRDTILAFNTFYDERVMQPLIKVVSSPNQEISSVAISTLSYGIYRQHLSNVDTDKIKHLIDQSTLGKRIDKQAIQRYKEDLYHPIWEKRRIAFMSLSYHSRHSIPSDYKLVKKVEVKFD